MAITMGKIMLFVVGFLLIGGYIIYQGANYDLDDKDDRKSFGKEVAKWMWDVGKKTKNVVGYVVAEDWLPENESDNETNETESLRVPVTIELG